jgi:hypothetical protein
VLRIIPKVGECSEMPVIDENIPAINPIIICKIIIKRQSRIAFLSFG